MIDRKVFEEFAHCGIPRQFALCEPDLHLLKHLSRML
jgi:hypothetical protein